MEERMLKPGEVAQRWAVHRATVLNLFHTKTLRGMVLGGSQRKTVRFRLSAVEAFERERETPTCHGDSNVV